MNTEPEIDIPGNPGDSHPNPASKVLLFLFGSLGDTLVALPSMRALRSHYPGAEIVLLQNIQSGGLVSSREVVPSNLVDRHMTYVSDRSGASRLLEYVDLWRRIRSERFDAAAYLVLTERSRASVTRDRWFFRSCGIPKTLGFVSYTSSELYPRDAHGHPARTSRESERKLERLIRSGLEVSVADVLKQPSLQPNQADIDKVTTWLTSNVGHRKALVAMAPGCKTQANEWNGTNFVELGRKILTDARNQVVVVGGPGDRGLGNYLVRNWGDGINAAGVFTVPESAALLSLCRAYVGPDTGTMHLAAAVGTPCFVIAGSRTNPGQWFPLGDQHMVVQHKVPCAGCHHLTCPVPGHPCTEGVTVDSAWPLLQEFLRSKPQSLEHIYV